MIDPQIHRTIESILKKDDIVIDIGGGRNPYFRANYVIDRNEYGEHRGIITDGEKKREPLFTRDTWISRDFYDLPWPFEDKQFDFSICTGTLEDVRDPIVIMNEIQRISKAGYISTPTRACETSPCVAGRSPLEQHLLGYQHHRWFAEIDNGGLVFTHKSPLIYGYPGYTIKNIGQLSLHFFWLGDFHYHENSLIGISSMLENYKDFYERHAQWYENAVIQNIDETMYNNWDNRFSTPRPQFASFFTPNAQMQASGLKNIKHKLVSYLLERLWKNPRCQF